MEILIFGLLRGALYSLIAVGFVLVFSVGGILNLAHGTFFMLGAYFTYIFYNFFNRSGEFSLVLAILSAIGTVTLFAIGIYMLLLKKRIQSHAYVMVMSLSIALFVSEVMSLRYGVGGTAVSSIIKGNVNIFGVRVIGQQLFLFPITLVILFGLWFTLKRTRIGRSVDAVAQNREGAILMGVNTEKALIFTMGVSSALAAVAGSLISPVTQVVPYMWVFPLIKAFTIAILGGLGSLSGAVIASFIFGFAEVFTAFTISEAFAEMVSLFIIIIILLFRPEGIMGVKIG